MVIRKIGRPANSKTRTKYNRLINEPNTICALLSGVDRRMLKVWASRSCVMAEAVNAGARKHIRASCPMAAWVKVCEASLANSAREAFFPLSARNNEINTKPSSPLR